MTKLTKLTVLLLLLTLLPACAPKFIPKNIHELKSIEDLGLASQRAYQEGRIATDKKTQMQQAQAGILYSEKCLKTAPQKVICLYYNTLNRGLYLRNHITNYQRSLKIMIQHCESLIEIDPGYEHGGCYRILGNIYAKAPSFSLNPKNITRDLDKSVEYLESAVELAPNYPLNRLFLARSLAAIGETQKAKTEFAKFDRLPVENLDKDYPEWKKERDSLAQKLAQ